MSGKTQPDPARGRRETVLFVVGTGSLGGAERSLLSLAARMPRHGWDVLLACPPGRLFEGARALGIPALAEPWRPVHPISTKSDEDKRYSAGATVRATAATLLNARRLVALTRELEPTVVVSNSLPSHLVSALAQRTTRVTTGWYLREIVDAGAGRSLLERLGAPVDVLLAISGAVARAVRHPRVQVIPDSIDVPEKLPAAHSRGNGRRPAVGYIGRLDPPKGVEDVCRAAAAVDADFLIAGAPTFAPAAYLQHLQALAHDGASGRVRFVGPVNEPWPFLAQLDVVVVPSRREPWGRVAAEAQIMGVPVVAADAGALPEIVRDGVDGLLYPPGRADVLAERLLRLLGDGELRRRLGAAGRAGAGRFDPETTAEQTAIALRQAVRRRRGS